MSSRHTPEVSPPIIRPMPPWTMRLEAGTAPLRVEVVPEPKLLWWQQHRWALLALVVAAIVALAAAVFWHVYVTPRDRDLVTLSPPLSGVEVIVSHPRRLAKGDAGMIDVQVANQGTLALSGVRATIVFNDRLAINLPTTKSNLLYFGLLEAGEGRRKQFDFRLAEPVPVTFSICIVTGDGPESCSASYIIALAPFPYLITLSQWLGKAIIAVGLPSLIAKMVFDWFSNGKAK
jgi:hypothetical protein